MNSLRVYTNADGTKSAYCLAVDEETSKTAMKKPNSNIPTGSTLYIIDTGNVHMYEETTNDLYPQ